MAALSLDVRDLLAAAWHVSTGSVTGSLCVTGCPQPLGPLTGTGEREREGRGGRGGGDGVVTRLRSKPKLLENFA